MRHSTYRENILFIDGMDMIHLDGDVHTADLIIQEQELYAPSLPIPYTFGQHSKVSMNLDLSLLNREWGRDLLSMEDDAFSQLPMLTPVCEQNQPTNKSSDIDNSPGYFS